MPVTPPFVPFEAEARLDWLALTDALAAGHRLPPAEIGDTFLYRRSDTLLTRSAWIDGLGLAVKTATIFPGNPGQGRPAVNGGFCLYSDADGTLEAVIDFHLVTKWKTAGDSLLAARRLARPESRRILIVGAGTVAASLVEAYGAAFPEARFEVWNRSPEGAARLAACHPGVTAVGDLEAAVRRADIVTAATMSTQPLIRGDWLQPGQHVDLIGAYRPDMREADDAALRRARLFVDNRHTVMDHIGEFRTPLAEGVIAPGDVVGDYYDLDRFRRRGDDEITLFKNGGGAHLDLMTGRYILGAWTAG
jgi:ornithine cyclodeaminase/alanine dehydrogenase-like protein (mu-crystallin family)